MTCFCSSKRQVQVWLTFFLSYTWSPHVNAGSTSVFKSKSRDHILPAGFPSTLSGAHWSLCSEPGSGPQRRECHPQPGQHHVCVCVLSHFSCVQIRATLWTLARQAPLSMGFSRQEYWSRLSHPPRGDLPNLGILFQNMVVWRLLRREWAYEKFLKTFNSGTGRGGHRCIAKSIN